MPPTRPLLAVRDRSLPENPYALSIFRLKSGRDSSVVANDGEVDGPAPTAGCTGSEDVVAAADFSKDTLSSENRDDSDAADWLAFTAALL